MVPYDEARTKTVWCAECINLGLILKRRKGFHNSHMRYGRGRGDPFTSSSSFTPTLNSVHPHIGSWLPTGRGFKVYRVQGTVVAFFTD